MCSISGCLREGGNLGAKSKIRSDAATTTAAVQSIIDLVVVDKISSEQSGFFSCTVAHLEAAKVEAASHFYFSIHRLAAATATSDVNGTHEQHHLAADSFAAASLHLQSVCQPGSKHKSAVAAAAAAASSPTSVEVVEFDRHITTTARAISHGEILSSSIVVTFTAAVSREPKISSSQEQKDTCICCRHSNSVGRFSDRS